MKKLSICIPTRNRAAFLARTIESIVCQHGFDDVEIVISDNCSTDDTQKICLDYVRRFPNNIVYSRNDEDILDANFPKALSMGSGEYLKLHNDTAIVKKGALDRMLNAISQAKAIGALPYFLNGNIDIGDVQRLVNGLDEFIGVTKYFNTWIATFGIWNESREEALRIMRDKSHTSFGQSWSLLHSICERPKVLVNNERIFDVQQIPKKGGYNVAKIFGNNYNELLKVYYESGKLSRTTYQVAKRDLLKFVNNYYFDVKRQYSFEKTGYFKWLLPFYKWNLYFYINWINMIRKKVRYRWKKLFPINH